MSTAIDDPEIRRAVPGWMNVVLPSSVRRHTALPSWALPRLRVTGRPLAGVPGTAPVREYTGEFARCCAELIANTRRVDAGWWRAAAERGSVTAQVALGCLHELGIDGRQDSGEAFHWFLQAASQGHPFAQYLLAEHCFARQRETQLARALYWWSRSACAGLPAAWHRLSELFYDGAWIIGDNEASYFWNLGACEHRFERALGLRPLIERRLDSGQQQRVRRAFSTWAASHA